MSENELKYAAKFQGDLESVTTRMGVGLALVTRREDRFYLTIETDVLTEPLIDELHDFAGRFDPPHQCVDEGATGPFTVFRFNPVRLDGRPYYAELFEGFMRPIGTFKDKWEAIRYVDENYLPSKWQDKLVLWADVKKDLRRLSYREDGHWSHYSIQEHMVYRFLKKGTVSDKRDLSEWWQDE